MSSLALLLTLVSSLGWAGFDVARKVLVQRARPGVLVVWLNLVQIPGFLVWQLLEPAHPFDHAYFLYFGGSLLLNLAANLFFLRALKRSPISSMIPLLGLTPVFTAVIGLVWLNEAVAGRQWAGIVCVVVGAFVLNARPHDLRRPWTLVTTLTREPGTWYMTSVAVLWSVAPFFDKRALEHASVGVHGTLLSGGIAGSMALALGLGRYTSERGVTAAVGTAGTASAKPELCRRRRSPPGKDHQRHRHRLGIAPPLAASAVSALIAFGCQLLAIQLMYVSLFEGLKRGVGMSLSVLSGRLWFGEPVAAVKASAVAMMTCGVLLLV